MKTMTRRIVFVAGLCVGIVALTIVGVGLGFIRSHRKASAVSAREAEVEFAQLRARFPGQQPLLDMNLRRAPEMPGIPSKNAPLRTFHTVIFDTRGQQRMVSITVPFWFARRFADRDGEFRWLGELTFLDDTEFDPEAIRLSSDQIQHRGPGLVAYYKHPSGGQFISWVD